MDIGWNLYYTHTRTHTLIYKDLGFLSYHLFIVMFTFLQIKPQLKGVTQREVRLLQRLACEGCWYRKPVSGFHGDRV